MSKQLRPGLFQTRVGMSKGVFDAWFGVYAQTGRQTE